MSNASSTTGKMLKLPCPSCVVSTAHVVVVSVDKAHNEEHFWWSESYQVVRCMGCETYSFRREYTDSESFIQISETDWEQEIVVDLYPYRASGRRDLGKHVRYLPAAVKQVYMETLHALNGESPLLAGAGIRILVEAVCQAHKVQGRNLKAKIDKLVEMGIITQAGSEVLHKIRTLGNSSVHEIQPFSTRQLSVAMDIVENMLREVFILPRLASAFG